MPLKRRAVMCLFLLPFALLMATKLRSQSRAAAATKQAKPAPTRKSAGGSRALSAAQRQWVDGTLRKMTVDEKIGQLLFTTYHGTFTATDSPAYQQMMHDVRDLHAGGFILVTRITPLGIEKSQAYPTAVLNNQLQSKSKLPLLIGADFERGSAMRLDEGTSFPTQMAIAAGGDPRHPGQAAGDRGGAVELTPELALMWRSLRGPGRPRQARTLISCRTSSASCADPSIR